MFADEASVSINASVRRTYAPRGQRPVIKTNSEVGKRVYAASAISENGDLVYEVREKAYDAKAIIGFLRSIFQKLNKKIILIWDNASIHDCEVMRLFLSTDPIAQNIHLAKIPIYSPQFNPDEQVWNIVKNHGLYNTCYRVVKELVDKLEAELASLSKKPELIRQFFKHPDVHFYA
ncbi:MAG: transposase [Saprospiraceae bacterium]|nr:transposase [Saprospiraceae bacterium]